MNDHTNIIGICMGDAGVISRVLGVRAGSAFTFAAATPGEETGPGQIAARTLIETYRIDQVDAATKVYGVAGNPIRSSLSPIMMNTAFRRETVNAVYLALQTNKLADLLKLVHEIPIQGVSITMPLKQEILPHLEQTDPLSAKIGAVNTIRLLDGKLYGFNTDVAGIIGPLEKRLSLRGAKVLVLGAGGAARAAVFGVRDKRRRGLHPQPHPRDRAEARPPVRLQDHQEGRRSPRPPSTSSSTPRPSAWPATRRAPILEAKDLNTRLVFDLVYNPLETPLIRLARQQGIPIITGVEMFVQQGARQFEIFTGKPAPEEEMFRVVLHALRQQAEAAAHADPEPAPKGRSKSGLVKPARSPSAEAKPAAAKARHQSRPQKQPHKAPRQTAAANVAKASGEGSTPKRQLRNPPRSKSR